MSAPMYKYYQKFDWEVRVTETDIGVLVEFLRGGELVSWVTLLPDHLTLHHIRAKPTASVYFSP